MFGEWIDEGMNELEMVRKEGSREIGKVQRGRGERLKKKKKREGNSSGRLSAQRTVNRKVETPIEETLSFLAPSGDKKRFLFSNGTLTQSPACKVQKLNCIGLME